MRTHLAVADALRKLEKAGVPNVPRDVRLLLAAALDVPLDRLTLERPDDLNVQQALRFHGLVARRAAREPMSQILERREFWGRSFRVTPDVLDPRGDTETLIAASLELSFRSVLDLGTGSGCIALTLLAEREAVTGVAADVSQAALVIAQENANALGVTERCDFVVSDWYAQIDGTFDLIVSNPPYIALDEMDGLAPELSHEPRMALTDEGDGLSCYRIITAGAGVHLTPGGWLMVEIGPTQGAAVVAMFEGAGLVDVGIRTDLDGRDRVVMGQKPL